MELSGADLPKGGAAGYHVRAPGFNSRLKIGKVHTERGQHSPKAISSRNRPSEGNVPTTKMKLQASESYNDASMGGQLLCSVARRSGAELYDEGAPLENIGEMIRESLDQLAPEKAERGHYKGREIF